MSGEGGVRAGGLLTFIRCNKREVKVPSRAMAMKASDDGLSLPEQRGISHPRSGRAVLEGGVDTRAKQACSADALPLNAKSKT